MVPCAIPTAGRAGCGGGRVAGGAAGGGRVQLWGAAAAPHRDRPPPAFCRRISVAALYRNASWRLQQVRNADTPN